MVVFGGVSSGKYPFVVYGCEVERVVDSFGGARGVEIQIVEEGAGGAVGEEIGIG